MLKSVIWQITLTPLLLVSVVLAPPASPAALEEDDRLRSSQQALRRGDFEQAIAQLKALLKTENFDSTVLYLLGSAHYFENDLEEATRRLEEAQELAPADARVYFRLYQVLQASGQVGAALDILRKAVELQPELTDWREILASEYIKRSRYDEAIKEYQSVLRFHSDSYEIRLNLAFLLFVQQDPEFVSEIARAFSLDATEADSFFYKIFSWNMEPDHLVPTLLEIKMAAGLAETEERAYFQLGKSYLELSRYAQAREAFSRYLEFRPRDREAVYYLALTFALDGRYKEAAQKYEELYAVNVTDERVAYGLADAYFEQNAPEKARTIVEKLFRPETPVKMQFLYGRILANLGETDKAINIFRKIARDEPDFIETEYQLGRLLAKKGEFEQSRHFLSRYQRLTALEKNRERLSLVDLPFARVNVRYSESLQGGGGSEGQYKWSLVSGELPESIELRSEDCQDPRCGAVLSGIPTRPGIYVFTLQVRDDHGNRERMTYTLQVAPSLDRSGATGLEREE